MGQLGTQPVPTGPADRPSDTHLVVPAADTPGNASAAARLAAPVAQQVAHQIAPQLRHQMEQIRFDLYPVELGRVTVRLRMRETGAQLVIAVEKPAALEALRIGIGHLQSNLAQAGVEIESRSVSLQLAADGQSQEGGRGRDDQRPGTKDAQAQADLKPEDAHGRDDAPGALFL
jgi:flagellar hook-length control protein FliK